MSNNGRNTDYDLIYVKFKKIAKTKLESSGMHFGGVGITQQTRKCLHKSQEGEVKMKVKCEELGTHNVFLTQVV